MMESSISHVFHTQRNINIFKQHTTAFKDSNNNNHYKTANIKKIKKYSESLFNWLLSIFTCCHLTDVQKMNRFPTAP